MDGIQIGLIGIGTGIVGLLIAAMLYKKIDSIKIENETVAKITQRIQDGAMAFLYAEYRSLLDYYMQVVEQTMTLDWIPWLHSSSVLWHQLRLDSAA